MDSDNCQICGKEYSLDDLSEIKLGQIKFENLKICKLCIIISNDLDNLKEAEGILSSIKEKELPEEKSQDENK